MASIASHFESGKQSSNKSHFRNLVMLARVDGKVGEEELGLLNRIASRLSLTRGTSSGDPRGQRHLPNGSTFR